VEARACATELEAAVRSHVLGSLLHSARGLQLSTDVEAVAVSLELCIRDVERLVACRLDASSSNFAGRHRE
jgi:hypothetical protein